MNAINPFYKGTKQTQRLSGAPGIKTGEEGRSPFRKDYARLLHAPAFRRLQGKTQLYPGVESDFFRNRLTHSLEVAQIGRGIAARLNASKVVSIFPDGKIDEDLVDFACIAHDLGHPPFGHNGEYELDSIMRNCGGFEGNAQTLRILCSVEKKIVTKNGSLSSDYGLDLTYRSLASILKYDREIPIARRKSVGLKKGYYFTEKDLVNKIKKFVSPGMDQERQFKTVECSIMDLADDIAYSTYDLEDSLHGGFVSPLMLAHALAGNSSIQQSVLRKTNDALEASGHQAVKDVGELLNVIAEVFGTDQLGTPDQQPAGLDASTTFGLRAWSFDSKLTVSAEARTQFTAERVGRLIDAVEIVPDTEFPQLSSVRLQRPELLQVELLKHLNYELVVRSPRLAVAEHRGKDVVKGIFEALQKSKGALLPPSWQERFAAGCRAGKLSEMRVLCDYIACMTDMHAIETYERLYGDGASIFKPI